MSMVLARKRPRGARVIPQSQSFSLSAPVRGWNTRDSAADMDPLDAVELENFFPEGDRVTVRSGYASHATGVGSGDVETVAEWRGPASSQLIVAGGGELYNATSAGSASVITSSAGYSSDRWQTCNFKGRLFGVNGEDAPWDWTGSTLTSTSWSGTGLTIADLIYVHPFKGRLYFAEAGSASFWYGGVGAVTGTLTEFDLSQIVRRGGYLMAIGSWSQDAGDGLDDLICFVFSTGEVLIYQGTDPASASTFAMVGSYFGGRPLSRRCLVQIGGELVVITENGYIPISLLLQGGTADTVDRHPVWGRIRTGAARAAVAYHDNYGWEAFASAAGKQVIFNVPVTTSSVYQQHVLNPVTGAWALYKNLPARTWGEYDGDTYFGGEGGIVYKMTGATDAGDPISFRSRQAFNYFGDRGSQKRFTALRPTVELFGDLTAVLGLDTDYQTLSHTASVSLDVGPSGATWDVDAWDVGEWGGGAQTTRKWLTVTGIGRSAAIVFAGTTPATTVNWYATDVLLTRGAVA
jgi:hypothetical protein